MFETVSIQQEGNGRLSVESRLVRDYCLKQGIEPQLYTTKRIRRRQLPLTLAISFAAIPIPASVYYPSSLKAYLRRAIWSDTVGGLRSRMESDGAPVFAKPAGRAKHFTGRVFFDHSDLYFLGTTSRHEPVWCSEIVSWLSEYRVYVVGGQIASVDHYDGDPGIALDQSVIAEAVSDFRRAGEAPAAYGVDFGVLSSGKTALVEANDGYALGAYKISDTAYSELLFARWRELLSFSVRP